MVGRTIPEGGEMLKKLATVALIALVMGLSACSAKDPNFTYNEIGGVDGVSEQGEKFLLERAKQQLEPLGLTDVVLSQPHVGDDLRMFGTFTANGNGCSLVIHRDPDGRLGLDVRWEDNQRLGSIGEGANRRGIFWFTDLETLKRRDETKNCKFTPPAPTAPTN